MNTSNKVQPTKPLPNSPEGSGSGAADCSLTRYQADVMKSAEKNHMWLNAFSCIHPTDEMKIQIGEWVLSRLKDPESCIQANHDDSDALRDLKQPEVILRFNKS